MPEMKKIHITIFLILSTNILYCQSELLLEHHIKDSFAKSEIISDLNYMIKKIEDIHPNPYHSNSKETILTLRDSIISLLPDTVSKHVAYLTFKQMTAIYYKERPSKISGVISSVG